MSLYGALFSGVSGLSAQSSAMGAIADNVTNVNTIGYKGTDVQFGTLVTKQTSSSKYAPGGVQSKPRGGVDLQGLLQATSSSTDVSVSGNGFFIVNEASTPASGDVFAYTRAGSFKVDKDGFLKNTSGWYMQGWPLMTWDNSSQSVQVSVGNDTYMKAYKNSAGDTVYVNDNLVDRENVKPLNLNTIGGTATATTTVSMGANLPSSDNTGATHQTDIVIYDTLGNSHNLHHVWSKRATNAWDVEVQPPLGSMSLTQKDQGNAIYNSMGRIDFTAKPQNGESFTITADGVTYTVNFANAVGDDTAVNSGGADTTITIGSLSGRSLSQVLDTLSTGLNNILTDAFVTTGGATLPTPPGAWAERVAGTNSLIFRNADNTAMALDLDGLTDGGTNRVTMQGAAQLQAAAASMSVPALAARYADANMASTHAITFNGDGTPDTFFGYDEASYTDARGTYEIDWVNGSTDMDGSQAAAIKMSYGNYNVADGVTQFAGAYQINYISQNGASFGNYAGVSIGQDGIVTALFDNGVTRPVFMIPIATMGNPNGMESMSGNVYIETDYSGRPTVREAGEGGAGQISAAALESSTVDIGQEFTNMITTQRAYSASAKIISTADQMLEELMSVKR